MIQRRAVWLKTKTAGRLPATALGKFVDLNPSYCSIEMVYNCSITIKVADGSESARYHCLIGSNIAVGSLPTVAPLTVGGNVWFEERSRCGSSGNGRTHRRLSAISPARGSLLGGDARHRSSACLPARVPASPAGLSSISLFREPVGATGIPNAYRQGAPACCCRVDVTAARTNES